MGMHIQKVLSRTVSYQVWTFMTAVGAVSLLVGAAFWWGGIAGSFLAMFLVPPLLLWAIILLVSGVIGLVRHKPSGIGAVVASLSSPIFFVIVLVVSGAVWDWAALAVNSAKYAEIVALAERGHLPARGKEAFQLASNGSVFEAERWPSGRIAFELPGGFLNNRSVILYDPTGVGQHKAGPSGEDLFDNWWTVEKCSPMLGHYFVCGLS